MKGLSERPVLIAGIGGAAWWILQGFRRNNLPVRGFVVSHPEYETTDTCCGLPVFKAADWKSLPQSQDEYVVILGVMNPKIDVERMKMELLAAGWLQVWSFAEYASKLLKEEQINCSMVEISDTPSKKNELQKIKGFLADSKSHEVFDHFLRFCSSFEENETLIDKTPYFASDLPRWVNPLRIVDCGAFNGDTVLEAIASGYNIEFSICCEPDPDNYLKLVSNLASVANVTALPIAVSDKLESKNMDGKGNTGSRLTDEYEGKNIVCISLDNLLPGGKPNLIKMDIEGYEYKALVGAQKLLRESRPGLAISIYHLSDDFTQIPLLLHGIFGDTYKYFVRRYSRTVADTILYAFPLENM